MKLDLSGLDKFTTKYRPNDFESALFIFWEKGIAYNEFCDLPIPYIVGILNTFDYVKKEEEKAYKKASKKK
jgi:hypothetical protein